MAASGYMTEVDTESIWNTVLDTTRFGKINVRIGEVLNFWCFGDAATDTTDTRILPILEQISEEALIELIDASKSEKFNDPWTFIQARVARITSKILRANMFLLREVGITANKKYHMTESATLSLPRDYTSLLKRTTS